MSLIFLLARKIRSQRTCRDDKSRVTVLLLFRIFLFIQKYLFWPVSTSDPCRSHDLASLDSDLWPFFSSLSLFLQHRESLVKTSFYSCKNVPVQHLKCQDSFPFLELSYVALRVRNDKLKTALFLAWDCRGAAERPIDNGTVRQGRPKSSKLFIFEKS